jgi:hypothetical protein
MCSAVTPHAQSTKNSLPRASGGGLGWEVMQEKHD